MGHRIIVRKNTRWNNLSCSLTKWINIPFIQIIIHIAGVCHLWTIIPSATWTWRPKRVCGRNLCSPAPAPNTCRGWFTVHIVCSIFMWFAQALAPNKLSHCLIYILKCVIWVIHLFFRQHFHWQISWIYVYRCRECVMLLMRIGEKFPSGHPGRIGQAYVLSHIVPKDSHNGPFLSVKYPVDF